MDATQWSDSSATQHFHYCPLSVLKPYAYTASLAQYATTIYYQASGPHTHFNVRTTYCLALPQYFSCFHRSL